MIFLGCLLFFESYSVANIQKQFHIIDEFSFLRLFGLLAWIFQNLSSPLCTYSYIGTYIRLEIYITLMVEFFWYYKIFVKLPIL